MKGRSPTFTQKQLDIVGSTKFGRYPKISVEQTFNMIISDEFLVPFAGYEQVASVTNNAQGRAIFTSVKYNHLIMVIGNIVYAVSTNNTIQQIGQIQTFEGPVYIDENNLNQIAICDLQNIYIFNYITPSFSQATIDFIPGYITFQDGRFISPVSGTNQWRLSSISDGGSWPNGPSDAAFFTGLLQTKPDNVVAAQRFPGRGNLLYLFGSTVTEMWQDVGGNFFPYQRNSAVNIDYGCLNPATIAYNETIIVWLAANEKSGPFIAYSTGGDITKISTDGIDFKFTQLTNPSNSYGFLFRQDGHLIYVLTFPQDNLSYAYDFNTQKFFTLSDQNFNAYIAKSVAFFNDKYYFVSNIDGNLYQMGTAFTTYNGNEIPRVRVCKPIRLPDASRFAVNNVTFTIEQGTQMSNPNVPPQLVEDPLLTDSYLGITTDSGQPIYCSIYEDVSATTPQVVALSVSKNGGESFGTVWSKPLNSSGNFRNRLIYWNLGATNDFTAQFRFWGFSRFICTDGIASIYQ